MRLLGYNRSITQDYYNHKTAEDYSAIHKSEVKMNGRGKVVKIIDKFISHEDSINYNTFLQNQKNWYKNGYYHCISITGKTVKMKSEELGGNQVWIETYDKNTKVLLKICHLDTVKVKENDIVDSNTVVGLQGNTGLVLSRKSTSDKTYGTHIHFEVIINGNFVNPRKYADGSVITRYETYGNDIDTTKNQIKILVDKINIRKEANEESEDLGDVYYNEFYDVLKIVETNKYTWYKINTKNNITGYVASLKDGEWIEYIEQTPEENKENDSSDDPAISQIKLVFECVETGNYYIKLYKGEKLFIEK